MDKTFLDRMVVIAVIVFLILTAMGNPNAMVILLVFGLFKGVQFVWKSLTNSDDLLVTLAFTLALVILFIILLKLILEHL